MKRLLTDTDDAFELALLRSAKVDIAPSDAAEKAAIALGATVLGAAALGAAASGSAVTATGTAKGAAVAGKLGAIAIWKWIGLGIIVGTTVTMGTEHVVRHAEPSADALRVEKTELAIAPARVEAVAPSSAPVVAPETLEPAPVPSAAIVASARPARVEAPPPSAAAISAEIASISAPPGTSARAPAFTVPAPNASALATEVAALDRARRALAARDPAEAIRLLDVYEREVPVRSLGPEAQVLRIEAVAARGDRAEAKRLGEQFLLAYPRDPHADRVRRLLATLANL